MAEFDKTVTVQITELREICRRITEKAGFPDDEAAILYESLIEADRRKVYSHGVVSLGRYVNLLLNGIMKPRAEWTVERDKGPVAVWDGERSCGQVLGQRAMEKAIEKARENGVGIVCVKRANHNGAEAHYAQIALKAGMIGVSMSTSAPTMAPWGGADRLVGNSPLAVAVPTKNNKPVILDMAQSMVAVGKIDNLKRQKKTEVPAGWTMDKDGAPTTVMSEYYTAAPFGAYKGFGLALIIEVISGMMFGGSAAPDSADRKDGPSLCMCAIDIDAFSDRDAFLDAFDARIDELKSSRLATGTERLYMPGEIEHDNNAAAETEIEFIQEIVDEVNALAEKVGVDKRI